MQTNITCGTGGWHLEFYRDDDDDSGYGENAEVSHWYGSKKECEEFKRHADAGHVREGSLPWQIVATY